MPINCPRALRTRPSTPLAQGSFLCLSLLGPRYVGRTEARRSSAAACTFWFARRRAGRLSAPLVRAGTGSDENNGSAAGDADDELDRLLGIGRYRGSSGGFGSSSNAGASGSSASGAGGAATTNENGSGSEVQDTLADVMQMEMRRVRAKEELASDLEERKARMRAIGEELQAALDRDHELNRLRTEMGANYVMSETLQALDDVEAEVARIKAQTLADKAELAAWEAQTAEERSRGLFFKGLYTPGKDASKQDKQDTQDKQGKNAASPTGPYAGAASGSASNSSSAAAASAAAASPASPLPASEHSSDSDSDYEETESKPRTAAAAAQKEVSTAAAAASDLDDRPLSAASPGVRSPLRLYVFSYLSAFLALLLVNDLAGVTSSAAAPSGFGAQQVALDVLYGTLSAGLGLAAVRERQAMGDAQAAMLEGIRRKAGGGGSGRRGDKADSRRR